MSRIQQAPPSLPHNDLTHLNTNHPHLLLISTALISCIKAHTSHSVSIWSHRLITDYLPYLINLPLVFLLVSLLVIPPVFSSPWDPPTVLVSQGWELYTHLDTHLLQVCASLWSLVHLHYLLFNLVKWQRLSYSSHPLSKTPQYLWLTHLHVLACVQ